MVIVGLNIGTMPSGKPIYDGGACLIAEGRLRMAVAEERISRRKHDGGFRQALPYVLSRAGADWDDIDLVVVSTYGDVPPLTLRGRLEIAELEALGDRVTVMPSHHLAHAYSAFIPSPFDEALIIVMDNEGNVLPPQNSPEHWRNRMERVSIYLGRGSDITLLGRDQDEDDVASLGEVYGNFTSFLGLGNYLDAGKTMGLAPYGDPDAFSKVELFEIADGRIRSRMRNCYGKPNPEFERFFSEGYGTVVRPRTANEPLEQVHADLAYLVQDRLERILIERVRALCRLTGQTNLCMAGGVALNCVANRRILDATPIKRIWIQPSCGDQGLCYGNALFGQHALSSTRHRGDREEMRHAYYGGSYSDGECEAAILKAEASCPSIVYSRPADIALAAAQVLAEGSIVGWMQGASEFGPRALGHRSILADPRLARMKDLLNERVKERESFRPYAPSVLFGEGSRYFDLPCPSPFMLLTAEVGPERRTEIPAVTHVDGTARVQTVTPEDNGLYHDVIAAFGQLTGVPVVLNTSFNRAGEPIVETPADALEVFMRSGMDYLAIGGFLVAKRG